MLLLDLTIYLFVQGPGFVGVAFLFFVSPKVLPFFDHLASFYQPRFSRFLVLSFPASAVIMLRC